MSALFTSYSSYTWPLSICSKQDSGFFHPKISYWNLLTYYYKPRYLKYHLPFHQTSGPFFFFFFFLIGNIDFISQQSIFSSSQSIYLTLLLKSPGPMSKAIQVIKHLCKYFFFQIAFEVNWHLNGWN